MERAWPLVEHLVQAAGCRVPRYRRTQRSGRYRDVPPRAGAAARALYGERTARRLDRIEDRVARPPQGGRDRCRPSQLRRPGVPADVAHSRRASGQLLQPRRDDRGRRARTVWQAPPKQQQIAIDLDGTPVEPTASDTLTDESGLWRWQVFRVDDAAAGAPCIIGATRAVNGVKTSHVIPRFGNWMIWAAYPSPKELAPQAVELPRRITCGFA